MISRILTYSSVFILAGCAYIVDGPTQEITFLTPGAHNAVCYAYANDVKYVVKPPQTIKLTKSFDDLVVDCLAPGNRRKKIFLQAQIEDSFTGNLATAGGGMVWDAVTESMFAYPDVIEIDFTHTPVKPEAMPDQNQPDIRQPEDYDLEEFRPGLPRLNSDRDAIVAEPEKRVRDYDDGVERIITDTVEPISADELYGGDGYADPKVDPAPVIEMYNGGVDLNPAGEASGADDPVPLYPGQ